MKTKRTGFTLVELLVVIAIIALLMGILMPALAKVRHIAYRMVCGNNVGGIGKAMMVYANDNSETYPISGGKNARWSTTGVIGDCEAPTETLAFTGRLATITSCFYYLVRFAEMPPKQFICKGDVGAKEMKLPEFKFPPKTGGDQWTYQDFWDFGDLGSVPSQTKPGYYCSYSYQMPFTSQGRVFTATAVSSPETPVVADRNPMMDKNAWGTNTAPGYYWGRDGKGNPPQWQPEDQSTSTPAGPQDPDKTANSAAHQRDGQNVLFNDSHVSFELTPWSGIQKDEIYYPWCTDTGTPEDRASIPCGGTQISPGTNARPPYSEEDAFLVNEVNALTW